MSLYTYLGIQLGKTYIALNDIIGKSPVYHARDLWNKLNVETRNMHNLDHFKTCI